MLDADDIVLSPELLAMHAKLVSFDLDKLCFSWNLASEEELEILSRDRKVMRAFLYGSSKIDTSKAAGNIDIDAEAVKWRGEFGRKEAGNLKSGRSA